MGTYTYCHKLKWGNFFVTESEGKLSALSMTAPDNVLNGDLNGESQLSIEVARQLEQYFDGTRQQFDLPILMDGTPFQQAVYNELINIPYGQTRSYGFIAKAVGNSKASRAVGNANNRNPLMIVVPCHRVIGASGKLVGYAGGLELKQRLIDLEKSFAIRKI